MVSTLHLAALSLPASTLRISLKLPACFQKYRQYGYHQVAFNEQLELPLEAA